MNGFDKINSREDGYGKGPRRTIPMYNKQENIESVNQEHKVIELTEELETKQQRLDADIKKYGGVDKFRKAIMSDYSLQVKYGVNFSLNKSLLDLMDSGLDSMKSGARSLISFIKDRIESRKSKNNKAA